MKKILIFMMLLLITSTVYAQQFRGTAGEFIEVVEGKVILDATSVSDGKAHYFNSKSDKGKITYFFIAKSPDGKLRAALNGCQVCGGALQGFRQEGKSMVCNTCGNAYPLNKIATEKGGCNPVPVNPDLKVIDGKVEINFSDMEWEGF